MSTESFSANEKVLCFYGPVLYEAKVVKAEKKKEEWTYLIHYVGWSKSWDVYVPGSRLLKYTEDNLKRKMEQTSSETSFEVTKKSKSSSKIAESKRVGFGSADSPTISGSTSATVDSPTAGGNVSAPVDSPTTGGNASAPFDSPTKGGNASAPVDSPTTGGNASAPFDSPTKGGNASGTVDSPATSGSASATESRPSSPFELLTEDGEEPTSPRTESKNGEVENTVEPAEPNEENDEEKQVTINLPLKLKRFLRTDLHLITRDKKLFSIPARKSVDSILAEFIASRGDTTDHAAVEFCTGVLKYFNIMLGCQLLYSPERKQHEEVVRNHGDDKTEEELAANPLEMSLIYGGPHLMRLFTKLEERLSMTKLYHRTVEHFDEYMGYFSDFILSNFDEYLNPDDYETSSEDYQCTSPV